MDDYNSLRYKKHKLGVYSYLQSTATTCIAASGLMALNFLNPENNPLNQEEEMKIHKAIRFWEGGEGEYGSYPKLGLYALKQGLNVDYHLVGPEYPDFIPENIFSQYMDEFLPVIEEAKTYENFNLFTDDFKTLDIIEDTKKGPVIVEIKYPSSESTHNIVIRGHENTDVLAVDPLSGFRRIPAENLEKNINISYMKNYMVLSNDSGREKV